jgi:hypothetical protein
MGLGLGYMGNSATIEGSTNNGTVDAKGVGLTLELDIGAAISPGFILAGSFSGHSLSNAKLSHDTRMLQLEHNPQLSMLAVMADIYPNHKLGFHVGGALGLASVSFRDNGDPNGNPDENGFGFAPHIGYEWWVGNYWGIGVLGRFVYARAKGDYASGTETDSVSTGAVSFTATYN